MDQLDAEEARLNDVRKQEQAAASAAVAAAPTEVAVAASPERRESRYQPMYQVAGPPKKVEVATPSLTAAASPVAVAAQQQKQL